MACAFTILGMCFNAAPKDTGYAIFGFSEFVTALALLVLVYNSTDLLYRFRISIAPLPLKKATFVSTTAIGVGTLVTDLWFAEQWYAPAFGVPRATLQGIFGLWFLLTVLLWMWFAFIRPPIFGRWNYQWYFRSLYHAVVSGSDKDLPLIAAELVRSSEAIVRLSAPNSPHGGFGAAVEAAPPTEVEACAHDLLLLLANRKLCRHIVASSPITAIALMSEAARQKKYRIPIGQFARNVTTEAILNKDSILYHEDNGFSSGLVAYVQPFSMAMYGNYELVERAALDHTCPLDIAWKVAWDMTGEQFEAYCRIVLITFKSFVETKRYTAHSTALFRAFEIIKEAGRDLPRLDSKPYELRGGEALDRVSAATGFVTDAIRYLGKVKDLDTGQLRVGREGQPHRVGTMLDNIAEIMFELIFHASYVKSPPDESWSVQYRAVWGRLFGHFEKGPAWKAIRFKVARLLFDEIRQLETWPNFQSSKILGICLNVIGFSELKKQGHREDYYALAKAVINWTRRNYLNLVEINPRVAEDCLGGGISFDQANDRLVKTYAIGVKMEPTREYLSLDQPPGPQGRPQ